MTALDLLRDDLARATDGDAWHGSPLRSLGWSPDGRLPATAPATAPV